MMRELSDDSLRNRDRMHEIYFHINVQIAQYETFYIPPERKNRNAHVRFILAGAKKWRAGIGRTLVGTRMIRTACADLHRSDV